MPPERQDAERWKQIEALYHAARARPSAERVAFLIKSCPDDHALRGEVESLLSQPESGEGFLDQPALARAAEFMTTPPASSMIGRSLGGYHLRSLLGAGGMGEVYLARDAKLGRDVAIKILPAAVVNDAGRLGRFDREARMLAALNHPNICAIYGFEEADGLRFLILELVDGETLADKLARIPRVGSRPSGLPIVEALAIARQVAEALDVAHEKGIVHRDLKPANIKITASGVVKVLDFGLAKAGASAGSSGDASHAPTVTIGGTQEGAVLGTPAYMSPEQARGHPVDKRSDIWAFGCVLHEMLSGQVAFGGDTVADTIAGILGREHDSAALPPGTPTSVRKVIAGCLTKDPKQRIRDIGDVRIALDDTSSAAGEGAARSRVRERVKWQVWLPWTLVGVLTIAIAGMVAWILQPPPAAPLHRNKFVLPEGQMLDGSFGTHTVALSPDGLKTAFVARVGSSSRLYVRDNQTDEIKEVPGAPVGVREPVFSPDSLWIAFYAVTERVLKKIAVTGGEPITICPIGSPFGMNWGPDGSIVVGQGANGILRVKPDANGDPIRIVTVENTEQAHGPQILPGGKYVLFTLATDYTPATGGRRDRWDKAQIFVQEIEPTQGSANRKPLFPGSDARYLATQKLIVYARGGRLYGVRFDLARVLPIGAGVDVVRGVSRATGFITGAANYSIAEADGGTLIHAEGPDLTSPAVMDLALITREGRVTPVGLEAGAYTVPRMSPDGTTVAYTNDMDPQSTVWTYPLSSTSKPRELPGGGNNRFPIWAGNTRIAFQSDRDYGIFWQAADGSDTATPLTTPTAPGEVHIPDAWSPISQTLLYTVKKGPVDSPEYSLWTLTLGGRPKPFGSVHSSTLPSADYSTDGKWIVYVTTERGVTTISVEPSSGTGPRKQLRQSGADTPKHPRWSRVSDEIFYDPRYGDFEAVSFTTKGGFAFEESRKLPKHPFQLAPPGDPTPYDVTRDDVFVGMVTWGQGRYIAPIPQTFVHVTQNWFDTLQAQVPYR